MNKYNPTEIEAKWQRKWEESGIFKTPENASKENKMYILPQLPYPSGSGLHVGHAEVYTACDIYARYQRMIGKDVLQVFGLDSFGLPAENYAIKTNVHPAQTIDETGAHFVEQVKSLGVSVDWDRFVRSSDPGYYKWTQWFFLLMYERGLAYRKKQAVNWCESCKTVLANEQVVDGNCERCDTQVLQKEMDQWYLRITDYADRLHDDLDKVDWNEDTVKRQRDWIGRSQGAQLAFDVVDSQEKINVFTTRPDTLFGATYMVLAPEHSLVKSLKSKITNWEEVEEYVLLTQKKSELDRQIDQEKTGVELKGIKAINPANGKEIPVWIADYVLASYGTGAIMAVPAHDERDFVFAKKFGLEMQVVVEGEDRKSDDKAAYTQVGVAVNSDFLNSLNTEQAKEKMIEWLEEKGIGNRKTQYKLRDWSVSRQRFWGAPIPMVYDNKGDIHPVVQDDLPVTLPNDVDFKPTGQSPLTYSESFQQGVEEKYGKGWKREVDTLDTFMCSSWYFFRYLDPHNDTAFASPEALKTWMPVDFYLGGAEHVNGHLLYSRFFTKVLYDAGYIDFDEPFTVNRHQGLILGEDNRKMSKRWGNVINPTDVVNQYGADTCRTYEMFMGPLEDTKPWNTGGIKGVQRFHDKVWKLQEKVSEDSQSSKEMENLVHKTLKKVSDDTATLQFNTAIAKLMELVNAMGKEDSLAKEHFEMLLKMLAPYSPHIAEELWHAQGNDSFVSIEAWPQYDESKLVEDMITLVVQVNGKVRANLQVPADIDEERAKQQALADSNVVKWLDGKEAKKVIYVKGKLVSVVM